MSIFSTVYCGEVEMREMNSQKKFSMIRKILRLFELNGAYRQSSIVDDEKYQMTDPVYSKRFNVYMLKATNFALLEAERKKAEAFMERQKQSFIC